MVRRGDDDGVHGLVREQFPEVVVGLCLWRPPLGGIHPGPVAVAQSRDVHVARLFQPGVHVPVVIVQRRGGLDVLRSAAHEARVEGAAPPQPIRPTLSRSLAPKTLPAEIAVQAATPAPVDCFMKSRLSIQFLDLCNYCAKTSVKNSCSC